jgi:hypothetical protein
VTRLALQLAVISAVFVAMLHGCVVETGTLPCDSGADAALYDAACPLGPVRESGCAWPRSLEYSKSAWICDCVTADDCPLRVEEALSCGACVENLRCGVGGDLLLTACAGPCPL